MAIDGFRWKVHMRTLTKMPTAYQQALKVIRDKYPHLRSNSLESRVKVFHILLEVVPRVDALTMVDLTEKDLEDFVFFTTLFDKCRLDTLPQTKIPVEELINT